MVLETPLKDNLSLSVIKIKSQLKDKLSLSGKEG